MSFCFVFLAYQTQTTRMYLRLLLKHEQMYL